MRNTILIPLELEAQKFIYRETKGHTRVDVFIFLISFFVYDSQISKVGEFLKNEKNKKPAFFLHIKINYKKTKQDFKNSETLTLIYDLAILMTPKSSLYYK